MVRHQLQFPVQLEGAHKLSNHPKNVPAVPSSLTSSLINKNCLSTLRDMMLQQQHQYQQQFQQKYQKIEEHNALPSHHTISASTSPNLSSKTSSPNHQTQQFVQQISPVPFRVLEAASENIHNSKKMHYHDGVGDRIPYTKPEQHNSSRTVREELAASRSKITKNGKFN